MEDFSLPRNDRILKKTEFKKIATKGKKFYTKHFIVITNSNGLNRRRVGITVSRKVGGASKRNRVKRLVRESFRLNRSDLPTSHDLIFIAKKGASEINYNKTTKELKDLRLKDRLAKN